MFSQCKICKINKPYKEIRNKRRIGPDGRNWNGRVCPDCYRKARNKTNRPVCDYICKFCGKEIDSHRKRALYCSNPCRDKASRGASPDAPSFDEEIDHIINEASEEMIEQLLRDLNID